MSLELKIDLVWNVVGMVLPRRLPRPMDQGVGEVGTSRGKVKGDNVAPALMGWYY